MTFIKAGYGFNVGADFTRAHVDTPITLAPNEHARIGHVIGYIDGDPAHKLGFMRTARVRVHVLKAAIEERSCLA